MDDMIRHGLEARKDWAAYHAATLGEQPRYHNRPDCVDGSSIADKDVRDGTDGRQLCEKCRTAEHSH